MTNSPGTDKLSELRAKTDRQLIACITSNLDRGLSAARHRADYGMAETHFNEACALLPVTYGATHMERSRLESKLAHLEELLSEFSVNASMRASC